MKKVIVKQPGEGHFTKDFGSGSVSHRIITARRDDCAIKVTDFQPKDGCKPGKDVIHNTDEFVYVLEGSIFLDCEHWAGMLPEGSMYYVPAGMPTSITALVDSRLLCVFFRGDNGRLPDDE